jgi:hypothetical protein
MAILDGAQLAAMLLVWLGVLLVALLLRLLTIRFLIDCPTKRFDRQGDGRGWQRV